MLYCHTEIIPKFYTHAHALIICTYINTLYSLMTKFTVSTDSVPNIAHVNLENLGKRVVPIEGYKIWMMNISCTTKTEIYRCFIA